MEKIVIGQMNFIIAIIHMVIMGFGGLLFGGVAFYGSLMICAEMDPIISLLVTVLVGIVAVVYTLTIFVRAPRRWKVIIDVESDSVTYYKGILLKESIIKLSEIENYDFDYKIKYKDSERSEHFYIIVVGKFGNRKIEFFNYDDALEFSNFLMKLF